MAHPQNSYRGDFAKERIEVGAGVITGTSTGNILLSAGLALSGQVNANSITQNSTAVLIPDGIALSGKTSAYAITQNSTGVMLKGGLALSGKATTLAITQNSTAVIFPVGIRLTKVALPSGRRGPGCVVMVSNSTGNLLALNTTGTTWKYLNVTSVLA
jgi:hypothetical protein